MDLCWWDVYATDARKEFGGQLHTSCAGAGKKHGITSIVIDGKAMKPYANSGAGAINLARYAGADRVILLGYDCQHTGGKAHHHGDHPKRLGNAARPDAWVRNFELLAVDLNGLPVINATRETALTCFPRMLLEDALCSR